MACSMPQDEPRLCTAGVLWATSDEEGLREGTVEAPSQASQATRQPGTCHPAIRTLFEKCEASVLLKFEVACRSFPQADMSRTSVACPAECLRAYCAEPRMHPAESANRVRHVLLS